MTTATIRRTLALNGITVGASGSGENATGTGIFGFIEETVADAVTDGQININIDVSAVKSFILISDQAVTVETNSGSAADDTIVLVANKPYVFVTGDYNSFLLGTDVTALFITNASGSLATISCYGNYDATP